MGQFPHFFGCDAATTANAAPSFDAAHPATPTNHTAAQGAADLWHVDEGDNHPHDG